MDKQTVLENRLPAQLGGWVAGRQLNTPLERAAYAYWRLLEVLEANRGSRTESLMGLSLTPTLPVSQLYQVDLRVLSAPRLVTQLEDGYTLGQDIREALADFAKALEELGCEILTTEAAMNSGILSATIDYNVWHEMHEEMTRIRFD
jgi:hypothetical protein